MARKKAETGVKTAVEIAAPKEKKRSGSLMGALLGVALVFLAFFVGAQYFTAKRSTTLTVCATAFTKEHIAAYRLPSGLLDRFAPEDQSSTSVLIPMAPQFTIVNAAGKRVKAESYVIEASSPRVVEITINPQNLICRIEELSDPFMVSGSAAVKGKREIILDKNSYFIGGTLVISNGILTGNPGDDLETILSTGDVVTLIGRGDEVAVLEIAERAGTMTVSSNVEGARVYVDGALRGKTPCVVTASPGERTVRVRADGYAEQTFPVLVCSLDETEVEAELALVTGSVTVSSSPSGATITVSGQAEGVTPATLHLKPGAYEVKVELARYYAKMARALVVQDANQTLDFALVRKPGTPVDEPTGGGQSGSESQSEVPGSFDYTGTVEGVLVRTATGYKVFGDASTLPITIPDDLSVIDTADGKEERVGDVVSGSRLRFYVDGKGSVVRAEYVWRAGASAEGTVGLLSGAVFRVAPSWEDMYLSTQTAIFVDVRRTEFYDLRVGDEVVASGPHGGDIRFIWVQSRPKFAAEVLAVTLSTGGRAGKTLQEYKGFSLQGHPLQAGSDISLFYPEGKETVSASQLQAGDRVRVWLYDNRKVVFGEVLLMEDFRITGIFLGEEGGRYYFSGFVRYVPAADLIVTGLAAGEDLQPGSKVLAAGRTGVVNYIEVQSEVTANSAVTGTVLGSKNGLSLRRDGGGIVSYTYAKDTWFADWVLRQDGLVSTLFPGDKVALHVGTTMNAVWAERTWSPPFKYEGTIESLSALDRTMVVGDKTSRKTITLSDAVTFMKNGESSALNMFSAGDKVRVSGRDKAHVDMVVMGQ